MDSEFPLLAESGKTPASFLLPLMAEPSGTNFCDNRLLSNTTYAALPRDELPSTDEIPFVSYFISQEI